MTKINTIAVAAIAGILSVGSALADTNQAAISGSQFGATTVQVQTAVGSTQDPVAGIRQAAQPHGWAQVVTDDNARR